MGLVVRGKAGYEERSNAHSGKRVASTARVKFFYVRIDMTPL